MAIPRIGGWLRTALLSALAVAAVVMAGIGATTAYYLSSAEALEDLVTRLVERYTGRALTIEGTLSIEVSLAPRVTAEGVRFANPAGSAEPDMARADYLSVAIDLPALLKRRVHILDLDARGGALSIEDPLGGQPNWRFGDGSDDAARVAEAEVGPRWRVLLQSLELRDVVVSLRLGARDPVDIRIEALNEDSDAREMLILSGNGDLEGAPFRIDGAIGPLPALIEAGAVAIDLGLRIRRTDLSVRGRVADLRTLTDIEVALSIEGPDASAYGALLGLPGALNGDVAFSGKIVPEPGAQRIVGSGHIGEFEMDADVAVDHLATPRSISGHVAVAGPDAAVLGTLAGFERFPSGPFEGRARGTWHADALTLEEVVFESAMAHLSLTAHLPNFPATEGGVAELMLQGPNLADFEGPLALAPLVEAPFTLGATLEAEDQRFAARLAFGGHTISAEGRLGSLPDLDGTRAAVAVTGSDIAEIARVLDLADAFEGAYAAKAAVAIDGRTLHATNVEGRNGPFELNGAITLPEWRRPKTFTANAALEVASLARAAGTLGIDDFPDRTMTLEADVAATDLRFRLAKGTLRSGGASLTASGILGDLKSLDGVVLDLTLDSPTLDALLPSPLPHDHGNHPASVVAAVRGLPESALEIEQLDLESGGTTLGVSGTLRFVEHLVGSRLDIRGRGRALAALLPPLGRYEPPEQPFEVDGTITRPDRASIAFDEFEFAIGGSRIELDGVADLARPGRTSINATAKGRSLSDLGQIDGRPFPDVPFEVLARLTSRENAIEVQQLTARWADNDLSASGSLDVAEKPRLELRATSRALDLRDLQQLVQGDEQAATSGPAPARRIPEIAIPFETLASADAAVTLHIARFRGRLVELEEVTVDARLEDGALELERLEYRDAIGSFHATGTLRPENGEARMELALRAKHADIGLFQGPDQPAETIPRYTIDAAFRGTGATTREIAASLDGSVLVASDGGRLFGNALDMWAGDFLTNVLELLNPFKSGNDPYMPLDCLVLNAKLDQGVVELRPGFVMRTDKVNMFVFGTANLGTEKLDLSLATQPRKGIGVSASSITNPYFKIGGSFGAPELKLDATSAALASGIATATGGLSILAKGVWDRLRGEVNPCPEFMPKDEAK